MIHIYFHEKSRFFGNILTLQHNLKIKFNQTSTKMTDIKILGYSGQVGAKKIFICAQLLL